MEDPTEPTAAATPPSADPPTAETIASPAAAGAPRRSRRAPILAALRWALTLGITCGLAAILTLGSLMLGVFGLAWIALPAAIVLILVGAFVWRRGMLPLAILSLALALPAAATQLGDFRIDPSFGLLAVAPSTAREVDGTELHMGAGDVFVDLREVRFAKGSTTRVAARSDLGAVIVALPTNQCLRTTIRYRFRPTYDVSPFADIPATALRGFGLDGNNPGSASSGPFGMTIAADQADGHAAEQLDARAANRTWGLLAWGRNPTQGLRVLPDGRNEWTRGTTDPNAATLELDLAGAEQMTVRDYPDFAAPLDAGWDGPDEQVANRRWPLNLQAPRSPGEMQYAFRPSIRTEANRERWLAWERRIAAFGKATARRYAGSCATNKELSDRAVVFETQPERIRRSGKVEGFAKRSKVPQRIGRGRDSMLVVEVNGLGRMKVIGTSSQANGWQLDRDAEANEEIS